MLSSVSCSTPRRSSARLQVDAAARSPFCNTPGPWLGSPGTVAKPLAKRSKREAARTKARRSVRIWLDDLKRVVQVCRSLHWSTLCSLHILVCAGRSKKVGVRRRQPEDPLLQYPGSLGAGDTTVDHSSARWAFCTSSQYLLDFRILFVRYMRQVMKWSFIILVYGPRAVRVELLGRSRFTTKFCQLHTAILFNSLSPICFRRPSSPPPNPFPHFLSFDGIGLFSLSS